MSDLITKQDYEKLKELKKQATELKEQLDALCLEALAITEEGDEGGFTFDYIWNDSPTLDGLLERLEIVVKS